MRRCGLAKTAFNVTSPLYRHTTPPMATHTLLSRRFNTDHETPQARSLIKLRLPSPLTGPNGSSISSSAVTGATRHNYHTVIVRFAFADIRQRCIHMSVWPVPAYSGAASSTQWLASQPLAQRNINIPFPCEVDDEPRPTPAAFGPPLQLAGYRDRRPSWVLLQPQNFDLPYSQMVLFPLPCYTCRRGLTPTVEAIRPGCARATD